MCNLYSVTKSQDAIRRLFGAAFDSTGNLPSMPSVFPDQDAPVVRNYEGGRELIKMRWGMPPPPKFGGPPGHQYPQHIVTALARLVEGPKPLPRARLEFL
jgi:putative SOS response-associated peptidase YedK